MNRSTVENDDMVLLSRREWLRLTALAGAVTAASAAAVQQLLGKTNKGNVNRLAALWLAVCTGQNWNPDTGKFVWAAGSSCGDFIVSIPKDMNPNVHDVFTQVQGIVDDPSASPAFTGVVTAWNNLTQQLRYSHPDTQNGILALAHRKPPKQP